jgi:transposase
LDIDTVEQLEQIIGYYIWRWLIERFFYLLKTGGANVEQLQLKTQHRLENAISTYSIVIMNVMKMRYLAENQPETPIDELGITK